ncbi:MAG TPA: DNA methyltransferase [Sedimentisphaerales bacterium]|nr:DNA methyltransferase [Sedimentisphaerales bacterium]
MEQGLLFEVGKPRVSRSDITKPKGYAGLAAFHKYWGKKPLECLCYLIENLTVEGEVVLDPFVGCGLLGREAVQRNRRFIGIDINPIAIELSKLFVSPPGQEEFSRAIRRIETDVRPQIDESYKGADGNIATHYLWEGDSLKSVWWVNGRRRQEFNPTSQDLELVGRFSGYRTKYIRSLRFFTNSRINASPKMTIGDLFTGRALRNIDLILESIKKQEENVRSALQLTLTAASGQMSKMVFAVSKRGKTTGKVQEGISIGSWVIGYWRPKVHFEVNVWNCFENKARKLMKALKDVRSRDSVKAAASSSDVIQSRAQVALVKDDARRVLETLPASSVSLILTDPPHSDRIPYLELSELWNAILGEDASFENEIVVSNARERNKGKDTYAKQMEEFFVDAASVLCEAGTLAILFNAYDSESWTYLKALQQKSDSIRFRGCFPMSYSARSVVQDNRKGALKYDYVLIYEKCSDSRDSGNRWKRLAELDGWSPSLPAKDK